MDIEIEAARDGIRPFPDLPWLCVDGNGDVAVFISAGFGQIPAAIFESIPKYAEALPSIEDAIYRRAHYIYDYPGIGRLDRQKPYKRIVIPKSRESGVSSLLSFPHVTCSKLIFSTAEFVIIDDYFTSTNS